MSGYPFTLSTYPINVGSITSSRPNVSRNAASRVATTRHAAAQSNSGSRARWGVARVNPSISSYAWMHGFDSDTRTRATSITGA